MKKVWIIKILSLTASVAGMLGAAWAGDRENKLHLEKLVNDRLK